MAFDQAGPFVLEHRPCFFVEPLQQSFDHFGVRVECIAQAIDFLDRVIALQRRRLFATTNYGQESNCDKRSGGGYASAYDC